MLLFDQFELFCFPQTAYICDRKVQLISFKHMITSRKISQVNVFAGSPWEVASVKNLLKAAYIEVSMKENGRNGFLLSVPCEYYTAAMRVIGNRKIS